MRAVYDAQADALYVTIAEGVIDHQREMPDGVILDLSAQEQVLGFEVMSPAHEWEWPLT